MDTGQPRLPSLVAAPQFTLSEAGMTVREGNSNGAGPFDYTHTDGPLYLTVLVMAVLARFRGSFLQIFHRLEVILKCVFGFLGA